MGKFNGVKLREYKNLKGLNSIACFHAFITEFCGFRDQNGKLQDYQHMEKLIMI